jgi:hypothetical protein
MSYGLSYTTVSWFDSARVYNSVSDADDDDDEDAVEIVIGNQTQAINVSYNWYGANLMLICICCLHAYNIMMVCV